LKPAPGNAELEARLAWALGKIEKMRVAEEKMRLAQQEAEEKMRVAQQEAEDSSMCVICLDAPRAVLFMPCQHMCCCPSCGTGDLCPMCRTTIEGRTPVYI